MNSQKINDKQQRLANCVREIGEILKKYNCEMSTSQEVTPDGRIIANTIITVK